MAQSLMELLASRTIVDCDTMDVEVPKNIGPFVDCTSNQAIAFFELSKPKHQKTIEVSIALSKKLASSFPNISPKELAVEIASMKLQLEISKYITGCIHLQVNTYHSYDTEKMINGGKRFVQLSKELEPEFDTSRICIKVPSTWEGLQACRVLQSAGIKTLATTLFNLEQAALAGEVGCHYIAPYVNELQVHFKPGFIDQDKGLNLSLEAQRYYEKHGIKTQVLSASLTSTAEIMELAGVHHITISPQLLYELKSKHPSSNDSPSLFDTTSSAFEPVSSMSFADDEKAYRIAFALSNGGEGERKLVQAINIFCEMQTKLEDMMSLGF